MLFFARMGFVDSDKIQVPGVYRTSKTENGGVVFASIDKANIDVSKRDCLGMFSYVVTHPRPTIVIQ
jgi:hypothetical protein